ncbi:MAG: hypothetical protein IJU98_04775 [Synergistaceae bacterium]|nr:hypothetical protein [Synergistaceae bacterium]
MKNYDGLFMSTYANQLPFGRDIVRGAYSEGYERMCCGIWGKGFYNAPKEFLKDWLADFDAALPLSRTELEEYVKSHDWDDPFPSEETMCLINALYNGNPNPYGNDLLSTANLASDINDALWDGLYDGYRDAIRDASEKCGVTVKEREDR